MPVVGLDNWMPVFMITDTKHTEHFYRYRM